jgi:hypothetical protein
MERILQKLEELKRLAAAQESTVFTKSTKQSGRGRPPKSNLDTSARHRHTNEAESGNQEDQKRVENEDQEVITRFETSPWCK